MADLPIPSLTRAREQKISELSTHFANDDLTLEDLERRIERVYKAASVAELDDITADLRAATAPSAPPGRLAQRESASVPAPYELETGRVLSIMSSTRRVGRWAVPRRLDIVAVMSDTKIDLTSAILPPGVVDIDLRVIMAAFKLIVPPNIRVINATHSVMSDVWSRADELSPTDVPATTSAPVIRLTGFALMAEVKVIVRRREDPYADDDDDD